MSEIPSAESSINMMIDCIHSMAASHAPVEASLGKVIAPLPDLKISYNGIILTKEDLYIDDFLLKKYTRTAKGQIARKDARGKIDIPSAKGNLRTNSQTKRGGAGKP